MASNNFELAAITPVKQQRQTRQNTTMDCNTTQTATESQPLFSSDSDVPKKAKFKSIFEKVKRGQFTRGVITDSSDEDVAAEDWTVRYRAPTTTKKGRFDIPYHHEYQDGKFGKKTVTYYVCREQINRGKISSRKPFLIRPSFVRRRLRRKAPVSPPSQSPVSKFFKQVNPVPSTSTQDHPQDDLLFSFQDAQIKAEPEQDEKSIQDIFEATGRWPTPPPAPVTPPPAPVTPPPVPAPVIVESDGAFSVRFQSETVKFSLYLKK
jgi:hypothetical protein